MEDGPKIKMRDAGSSQDQDEGRRIFAENMGYAGDGGEGTARTWCPPLS